MVKSAHITQGEKYLKGVLYHVGWTVVHSNSLRFSEFYERIVGKGSSKQKAFIVVAYKVLRIIYQVLQKNIQI
ncbi:hypothetical protein E6O52_02865 [Lactococcus lactis]|nr:hypothetical protein [Lactococcus lactis]TKD78617.1 hypothetical protein E6O52_02865 [Lactococcus lactis]